MTVVRKLKIMFSGVLKHNYLLLILYTLYYIIVHCTFMRNRVIIGKITVAKVLLPFRRDVMRWSSCPVRLGKIQISKIHLDDE